MAGRVGRIAMLLGVLLVSLPVPVWAGSSQAALTVGVVVPARCAVRMPGTLTSTELPATGDGVAMRCTKGSLPSGPGAPSGAVGPRITRSLVLPMPGSVPAAPRPLAETTPFVEAGGPRMVITVNF